MLGQITQTRWQFAKYFMPVLVVMIGGGGLLLFMVFLFSGSLNLANLGLSEILALTLDAFLCLAFFIQHSVMARKSFYRWSAKFLPPQFGGAVYAITSGVVVLALVIFWQESTYTLIALQGPGRWFLGVVFFLAIACVIWALSKGVFVLYRLQSLVDYLRSTKSQQPAPLITGGPYSWIRHPLYLSALLLLWSYPNLTLDRLLLNMLFTVWVIAATFLEERKLEAAYGETYRKYQRRVPMMIPWRIRPG